MGFEMKMGGRAGTMSLCIPYNVIEPVVDKLSNESWAAYKKRGDGDTLRQRVATTLDAAEVTATAILAETSITLSDLMGLEPGDVITTEKPAGAPLLMKIGDKRKYIGNIGQFKGNRAFKVTRPISPKDRV